MNFVEQVNKDGFEVIRMHSLNDKILMEINPTRGNMISSLIFEDKEMIYIDKENYISVERPRCGCPIMFPFIGRNENNQLSIDGIVYPTDIHGIVHTNKWILNGFDYEKCSVDLYTTSNSVTKNIFPFEFRLDANISLQDNEVIYAMKITNLSEKIMPCDLGFHPFFTISHLDNLKFDADTIYNPAAKHSKKYKQINELQVKGSGVILENCRFLNVVDEMRKVSITISNKKEFKNIMLWTGNETKFIVIEPLTSIPNAINDKVNKFNLLSGESIDSVWSLKLDSF